MFGEPSLEQSASVCLPVCLPAGLSMSNLSHIRVSDSYLVGRSVGRSSSIPIFESCL